MHAALKQLGNFVGRAASNTIYFMLGGENGPIFDSFCFTFEKWNKGGNGKVFGTFVRHFRS